jgi:phage replication-related protein YjqB (UPF0714/DUF867 family)
MPSTYPLSHVPDATTPVVVSGTPWRVTIKEALAEQVRINTGVLRRREHLTLHPHLLHRMGHPLMTQVFVTLDTGEARVMTVEQPYTDGDGWRTARMNADSYGYFGVPVGPVGATIFGGVTAAVNDTLSDAEAQAQGGHIEVLDDDGVDDAMLIMAPHGGDMEDYTSLQALRFYAAMIALGKECVCYQTRGYSITAMDPSAKWHTTMVDFNTTSFPLLGNVATRLYTYCCSFHGFTDVMKIELGGRAPDVDKNIVKAALEAAIPGLTVSLNPDPTIEGNSMRNPINRYCSGDRSMQLEQSYDVRRDYWEDVTDVMVAYYAALI